MEDQLLQPGLGTALGGLLREVSSPPVFIGTDHPEAGKNSLWWCMAGEPETTGTNLNERDSNHFPLRTVKQWSTMSRGVVRCLSILGNFQDWTE